MKQDKLNIILATILIMAAAISRVLMYPHNFSPVIGMAIFAGGVIKDKRFAFVLPIFAMLLADVMFEASGIAKGFWGWGQLTGYCILAAITIIAFNLKKINIVNVLGFSLMSSIIFFLLSNLAFFLIDNNIYHTYPNTFSGFIQCYVMALPFLKTSIFADISYSIILFGLYYFVQEYTFNRKVVTA